MTDPNVFASDWEEESGPIRGTRVGEAAGAQDLGAAVFELETGGQAAPYHVHHANEELLIVLSGTPELRTPQGKRTLEPGAVVAFPAGAAGAHRLRNTSDDVCRYVIVSTMRYPDIAEHVDTGTLLAMKDPSGGKSFPAGTDLPFPELWQQALDADT